jgi:3-mercaptopyruvate sulfurtransferase SseA
MTSTSTAAPEIDAIDPRLVVVKRDPFNAEAPLAEQSGTISATPTWKSSAAELRQLYAGQGVTPDKQVVAYCRIGERSSHTWFVLTRLLGYEHVKNYDGSWTEWGSLVGVLIQKGEAPALAHA